MVAPAVSLTDHSRSTTLSALPNKKHFESRAQPSVRKDVPALHMAVKLWVPKLERLSLFRAGRWRACHL